ncbi:hypothetical protein PTSG_12035 [Salpingoeca rosetta]|uniref:Uncharacterized protein n=1 Tax=Salpingoeca rosetta (strain ATCC 50818 / BSB-021) TaxID=946362 RepID=F2U5U3_SALR5|nr:uncharacterized protein PTSG_12035 [Salpingoeca rosetta]EGD82884.1 hypothetical protein PTSG_12035 [Salpingoeca rosetta]|eukprot:XP_004995248.1 hypothetical protein PTSG_12035 [Salpingoeca rosetta]
MAGAAGDDGHGPRAVKAQPLSEDEATSPGSRRSEYCDNRVITSKYTLLTFLPINLFEQFRRAANFYFLTMMIIAYIPGVAVIAPITSVLPLVFVIGVTAIKQAYEDYRRHRADAEINLRKTRILDNQGQHHDINYQDVRVGDIVKVLDGEEFPCDLVLLSSSIASHDCFITTANLDGEATLKVRYCPQLLHNESWSELISGALSVECSAPDPHLYEFDGTVHRTRPGEQREETESIGIKQLLLKGARLRNTDYIYGLAVYTGKDSKTALNQPKARFKFSTVERRLNFFLAFYFVFLLIMCTLSVLVHLSWIDKERRFWPIFAQDETTTVGDNAKSWLSFMLLYNWVIPISLYVTMELQKLAGSFLIGWDVDMYDPVQDEPAQARTSDLMEDVGQINYVFADKTGTLTENEMVFKHCNIGDTCLSVEGYYERLAVQPLPSRHSASTPSSVVPSTAASFSGGAISTHRHHDQDQDQYANGGAWTGRGRGGGGSSGRHGSQLYLESPTQSPHRHTAPSSSTTRTAAATTTAPPAALSRVDVRASRSSTERAMRGGSTTHAHVHRGSVNNGDGREHGMVDGEAADLGDGEFADRSLSRVALLGGGNGDDDDDGDGGGLEEVAMTSSQLSHDDMPDTAAGSTSTPATDVTSVMARADVIAFFECLAVCHTVTIEYEGVVAADGSTVRQRKLAASSPDEEALVQAAEMHQVGFKLEERTDKKMSISHNGNLLTYQIIHVLEFDSKRKRMSVLVRDDRGRVRLLLKGADSAVLPRTNAAHAHALNEERQRYAACQLCLDHYSRKGLRTLVVASRTFTQEEADAILPALQKANESLENRKKKLNALYNKLETNLTLLGVTAVEDRLQDGVPDTIVKIREAQIALWVLTGDKVQTAINISISAGHFTADHPRLKAISIKDPRECKRVLLKFYRRVEAMLAGNSDEAPSSPSSAYGTLPSVPSTRDRPSADQGSTAMVALILDDVTLAVALKHHASLFRALSMRCRAVLCCRLSPAQKAAVVRLVKTGAVVMGDDMSLGTNLHASNSGNGTGNGNGNGGERTAGAAAAAASGSGGVGVGDDSDSFSPPAVAAAPITLAIGDGANDVAMIREAHIGVGITGKEGRQAARTSDYSLARFRFLARLLLVHGHYSYWRMAYTVQYFFYKNLIYILPFIYFGPRTLFSAQTLYEQWLLTFWSVLFTSLPILCFGIFEQDIDAPLLMSHPRTYAVFSGNRILTWRRFAIWTLTAIWHGSVAYFGMTLLLSSMRPGVTLWWLGTAIYTLLLLLVTLKIATDTRNWTWITHVCTWGSLVVFVGFVLYSQGVPLVFGSGTTPGIFWSALNLWGTDYYWGALVVLVVVAMLPDYLFGFARRIFFPTYVQQLQAREWQRKYNGNYACVASCLQRSQEREGLRASFTPP